MKTIAIDIGNSQLSAGIFENGTLSSHFYCPSENTDEAVERAREPGVTKAVISSVVPERSDHLASKLQKFGLELVLLRSGESQLIKGCYPSMGADRIANLVAARQLFGKTVSHIVIDCGTATTLTAVDADAKFAGGFITLGFGATLDMLSKRTAQLPQTRAQMAQIDELGFDTESSILNGTLIAQVALIDKWIEQAQKHLGADTAAYATGGWCQEIARGSKLIKHVDPLLTLKGVYFTGAAEEVQVDQA